MKLALPYENAENAFRVISGDFVTTEDGTGIVHTAPTFGADDAKVAKEATPEIPPMLVLDEKGNTVPLVDLQGRFIQGLGNLSGKYVKNDFVLCGGNRIKSNFYLETLPNGKIYLAVYSEKNSSKDKIKLLTFQ